MRHRAVERRALAVAEATVATKTPGPAKKGPVEEP